MHLILTGTAEIGRILYHGTVPTAVRLEQSWLELRERIHTSIGPSTCAMHAIGSRGNSHLPITLKRILNWTCYVQVCISFAATNHSMP